MLSKFYQIFLFLSLSIIAEAQPLKLEQIPPDLQAWIPWVLADQIDYDCPLISVNRHKQCAWASGLQLDLTATKGQFKSQWQLYARSWITLPGDQRHWPLEVTANNQAVKIMQRRGQPQVQLEAGKYEIQGKFLWNQLPEQLKIPAATGLIQLQLQNKLIPYPEIKHESLWLKKTNLDSKKLADKQNNLEIQVFRQIKDTIPLQLTTQIKLKISGQARVITLSQALLKDFIPISLHSGLPAKINSAGELVVQVRAGVWQISLQARHPQAVSQLGLPVNSKNWPATELWVFAAQPRQRLVEIEQLPAIDPSQTQIPKEWQHLPAYKIQAGQSMRFKTIQRGDPKPEPNNLTLHRDIWLDFAGAGYTVQDSITGTMSNGWRLNALPETQLGQVQLNGKSQLITQLQQGTQGVEVRQGKINLIADSRITQNIKQISAIGWQENFSKVSSNLHLPAGWKLLAVTGVDNVPQSWLSAWTLLDLFMVLIIAVAISKLWSWAWGGFGLITLILCWHEVDAPQYLWLLCLSAHALIQVLPTGRFLRVIKTYRYLCWLALVLVVIPFVIAQIRVGMYPQLEKPWQNINSSETMLYDDAPVIKNKQLATKPVRSLEQQLKPETDSIASEYKKSARKARRKYATYTPAQQATNFNRMDPNAQVQTGLGIPQWQWNQINLSWNGAVDSTQIVNLWLLTPRQNMALNIIRVFLITGLSLLLFGIFNKMNLRGLLNFKTCWLVALPILFSVPSQPTYAAFPSDKILQELKTKLLQAPECLPECAQIATMDLTIDAETLKIDLTVDAQIDTAVPLPADYKHWFPQQVSLNQQPAAAMMRDPQGQLWLSLAAGKHKITLLGSVPVNNKFTLPLPLKPHYVTLQANAWQVAGVNAGGNVASQLHFQRLPTQTQVAQKKLEPNVFPAFIRVEKTLAIGLDWRMRTKIIKVISTDSPVLLSVPLLNGESVITPDVVVQQGKVQVNMSAQATTYQWESVLKPSPQIILTAPKTPHWTEIWRLDTSPIWHVETTGINVIHHQDAQGHWLPEWRPWAGETVTLNIARPVAVKGSTLTIENSLLKLTPNTRMQTAELTLSIRSSKAIQHRVTLPVGAKLHSVKIAGKTQAIRQQGQVVSLPIKPGKQIHILNWQQQTSLNMLLQSPEIDLGLENVNSNLRIKMPKNRWILFTYGPPFGPAVLFWGMLIVIIGIAFGLGRVKNMPLNSLTWFLLLLGLSQLTLVSALVVVAWFFALRYRQTLNTTVGNFNLIQFGLACLSLVAVILMFAAVRHGLLGTPQMNIVGNLSSAWELKWYQDRNQTQLPIATVISAPLMLYRILMLLWSLWLATALLTWLKWGWGCFATQGLWRKKLAK